MATIVLVNFDQEHGSRLGAVLRSRGHRVVTAAGSKVSSVVIEKHRINLMIVDLPQTPSDPWSELRKFCSLCREDGLPVPVLCHSRTYRGAAFELKIEKLGARLVYGR